MTTRQSKTCAAASPAPCARGARRVFVVACALLGVSCITPTLPPDDPPLPKVELLGQDTVLLSGVVPHAPASVFARNRSSGLIFGETTPDGLYDFEVKATPCDTLDFWYRSATFQSSPIRLVPGQLSEPPVPSSACSSEVQGASPSGTEPLPDAGSDAALD
jgi:hypothetical protein